MLGPREEIEDFAQEVFISVLLKASRLRRAQSLRALVARVTFFVARTELRRRPIQGTDLSVEVPEATLEVATRTVDAREALLRLLRSLNRLKAHTCAVLTLRLIDAGQLRDLAAILGLSKATIKRRLARGHEKVAVLIARDPFLVQYRSDLRQRRSAQMR